MTRESNPPPPPARRAVAPEAPPRDAPAPPQRPRAGEGANTTPRRKGRGTGPLTAPNPFPSLVGLTDERARYLLLLLGLEVAGEWRDALLNQSARWWRELEHHEPVRLRDPWAVLDQPGPRRAGPTPTSTPPAPDDVPDVAVAFPHTAESHELGHRWVPKAPPLE